MRLVLKSFWPSLPTFVSRTRLTSLDRVRGAVSRVTAWQRLGVASLMAFLFHVAIVAVLLGLSPSSANQVMRSGTGFSATLVPITREAQNLAPPMPVANMAKLPDALQIKALPPSIASVSSEVDMRERQAAVEAAWQAQYRLTSSVERRPQPLVDVQPVYPSKAGKMRGNVMLRLFINELGNVDKVIVVSAKPEGIFEEAAIEAFQKAKFSPGTILGAPVKSQLTLNVEFAAFTIE